MRSRTGAPRQLLSQAGFGSEGAAGGSPSVARAVAILDYMHRAGSVVSIIEIARSLGIPSSSAYQIVAPLVAGRLIERAAQGGITLGPRLAELALKRTQRERLLDLAGPMLEELRSDTGETVQLAILDRGEVVVAIKADGLEPVHVTTEVGRRIPVNWSAAGRILLSDLSPGELQSVLPAFVRPSPLGTATTRISTLIRQIGDARQRGVVTQASQSQPIIGAVAARVDGPDGRCAAALCVLVPVHRMSRRGLRTLENATRAAATRLSAALTRTDRQAEPVVKHAPRQRAAGRGNGSRGAAGSRKSLPD